MQGRDPRAFARRVVERRSSRRRSTPWLVVATLAAAAAVLFVWMRNEPSIRYKGSHTFQVFVARRGSSELLANGAPLAAGDQLAFSYSLSAPRHLLLLSIDDTGAITRYYPADTRSQSPLGPSPRAQLSVGVELDGHRGEERLVALFSRDPLDEPRARSALREALRSAKAHGHGVANMGELALPAEQTSIWFRKP